MIKLKRYSEKQSVKEIKAAAMAGDPATVNYLIVKSDWLLEKMSRWRKFWTILRS